MHGRRCQQQNEKDTRKGQTSPKRKPIKTEIAIANLNAGNSTPAKTDMLGDEVPPRAWHHAQRHQA